MLWLFVLGIWGGPAGAPPTFNVGWLRNRNQVIGPTGPQPVVK
jgi:hypothetical protein